MLIPYNLHINLLYIMYIDYNDKHLLYVHIVILILFNHFIYCKFYNYES